MHSKIIVALDGHSSCGKSTMAKWLSKQVGYIYVDTGAMYRAVTLFALRNRFITPEGIDENGLKAALKDVTISFKLDPDTNLPLTCLNGEVVEHEYPSDGSVKQCQSYRCFAICSRGTHCSTTTDG